MCAHFVQKPLCSSACVNLNQASPIGAVVGDLRFEAVFIDDGEPLHKLR